MAPSTGSLASLRRELAETAADPFLIAAQALHRCNTLTAEVARLESLLAAAHASNGKPNIPLRSRSPVHLVFSQANFSFNSGKKHCH
jgi:hypothetical protein